MTTFTTTPAPTAMLLDALYHTGEIDVAPLWLDDEPRIVSEADVLDPEVSPCTEAPHQCRGTVDTDPWVTPGSPIVRVFHCAAHKVSTEI